MAENDRIASIADASKPNAGRIYDYVLGGNHNFEVDRLAAQETLKINPGFPKTARTIRWFLGEAVRRLLADGFTQFVDFASGLPTVDHIHQIAPAGTRVVYSDLDPVTVAYGQEIIKDNPDTRYIGCNIATPERLIEDPALSRFIDKGRKTAIGMNGIAWFITDAHLGHALQVLHAWAVPGSRLFISDFEFLPSEATGSLEDATKLYAKLGQPMYLRTRETLLGLCKPWKVMEPGFQPLETWIGVKAGVSQNEKNVFGGSFVGGILEK